jgi:hypothetical protein
MPQDIVVLLLRQPQPQNLRQQVLLDAIATFLNLGIVLGQLA